VLQTDRIHTDFAAAFTDGARFESRHGARYQVRVTGFGSLAVPTGAVTFGYPYAPDRIPQLTRTILPGHYPLELALAASDGSEEPAAVRLRVSEAAVASWEPAVSNSGSFGTDIGGRAHGAIADVQTFTDLNAKERLGPGNWRYPNTAALEAQLEVFDRARHVVLPTGAELAVFSTGMGGYYAAYWGLTPEGELAELVVDLMALVENSDGGLRQMARD
jgi:hypothetical protein